MSFISLRHYWQTIFLMLFFLTSINQSYKCMYKFTTRYPLLCLSRKTFADVSHVPSVYISLLAWPCIRWTVFSSLVKTSWSSTKATSSILSETLRPYSSILSETLSRLTTDVSPGRLGWQWTVTSYFKCWHELVSSNTTS